MHCLSIQLTWAGLPRYPHGQMLTLAIKPQVQGQAQEADNAGAESSIPSVPEEAVLSLCKPIHSRWILSPE